MKEMGNRDLSGFSLDDLEMLLWTFASVKVHDKNLLDKVHHL